MKILRAAFLDHPAFTGMNVAANVAAFASPRQPTIASWGHAQRRGEFS